MRWLLQLYKYEVNDLAEKRNKRINNLDCILCIMYAVLSLVNAVWGASALRLFFKIEDISNPMLIIPMIFSEENFPAIKTILLLIINIIILFRLNIKLYIRRNEAKEQALLEILSYNYKEVNEVITKTWDMRIQLIKYVYLMDIVVILMNMYYKTSIETSLSLIVIIPIIVTLLNNLTDIAENKFSAKANILYAYGHGTTK